MAMKIEAETRKIISLSNELDNNNNNRQSDMSASTSLLPASIQASLLPTIGHILFFALQCFVSIFKPLISDSKLHRHILTWIISSSRKPKG